MNRSLLRASTRAFALAALTATFALAAPRPAGAQDVGLDIGTTPAPVQLEDLDGNTVDLARYIGKKPVLLEFWATWCPICQALEPHMETAYKRFGDSVAFLVIGVGVNQNPRSIKRHLEKHPVAGTVLWDGKGAATRAFEAPATSYVVMLDANGRVVYTGSGEDQDLERGLVKAVGQGS